MRDGKIGPAMAALPNDKWRDAVVAYVNGDGGGSSNDRGYTAAVRTAGFEGTEGSLRVTGYRIFHDSRTLAAIHEEVNRLLKTDAVLAMGVQRKLALVPGPQQLAAAKSILDRSGHGVVSEVQHTHEVVGVSLEVQQRALMLARKMGIDVAQLVGNRLAQQLQLPPQITVDAEYEEVVLPPRTLADIL